MSPGRHQEDDGTPGSPKLKGSFTLTNFVPNLNTLILLVLGIGGGALGTRAYHSQATSQAAVKASVDSGDEMRRRDFRAAQAELEASITRIVREEQGTLVQSIDEKLAPLQQSLFQIQGEQTFLKDRQEDFVAQLNAIREQIAQLPQARYQGPAAARTP